MAHVLANRRAAACHAPRPNLTLGIHRGRACARVTELTATGDYRVVPPPNPPPWRHDELHHLSTQTTFAHTPTYISHGNTLRLAHPQCPSQAAHPCPNSQHAPSSPPHPHPSPQTRPFSRQAGHSAFEEPPSVSAKEIKAEGVMGELGGCVVCVGWFRGWHAGESEGQLVQPNRRSWWLLRQHWCEWWLLRQHWCEWWLLRRLCCEWWLLL